jgi:D-arabinose 5-phosphate isomerase GutQ
MNGKSTNTRICAVICSHEACGVQVPLSGVAALLTTANDNGVLSVLDIDVQPSVATNEAGLGSTSEIIDCIKQARVLKPAMHAAREVVGILMPEIRTEIASMPADELGKRMRDAADCDLVALTDGGNGCALVTADLAITVPTGCHIDVIDATGAGDAFLGGLIAGIYNEGLPVNEIDLLRLGQLANATGAACCLAIGGLPTTQSAAQLTSLLAESTALDFSDCIVPLGGGGVSAIGMLAGFQASLANDSATLSALADSFDLDAVEKTVTTLLTCRGRVLVTGLGKSGVVAQRLAASLTSTGTAAHFVHAAEWSHGDLGVCRDGDVVVALSHSGKTPECVSAMAHIKARGTSVVAITSDNASPMAKQSDVSLTYTIPADMGMLIVLRDCTLACLNDNDSWIKAAPPSPLTRAIYLVHRTRWRCAYHKCGRTRVNCERACCRAHIATWVHCQRFQAQSPGRSAWRGSVNVRYTCVVHHKGSLYRNQIHTNKQFTSST